MGGFGQAPTPTRRNANDDNNRNNRNLGGRGYRLGDD